jgi:hypothetical protein
MKRLVVLVIAAIAAGVALSGCGGPYATPQSTFAIYRDAVARKDWKAALRCMTRESQDRVVGGLVVGMATASIVSEDAAAVLEKHGIDRGELVGDVVGGALTSLVNPREAIDKGMRPSLENIPDKPAFFADGMAWLEENNKQVADHLLVAAGAQLSDVQIEGDTATGTLSVPIAGGKTSLRFKKVNGRWLIDL